ncbi:MAG TPA: hypothetical protein VFL76_05255 [Edaphocola sp.]|nr:hypothetical protein [Edaphocola sp.]
MNQRSIVFLFCLLLFPALKTVAQPLSAFTDFQDHLMVWDNGMIRKIESLAPQKVVIGRDAIPYIDNSHNFKIYYHGGVSKVNDGFTNNFLASDDLVLFQNAKSLNVWDNGKITNLSKYCENYLLGDSLVLFFDGVQREYRAYYDGHIYPIEGFLAANSAANVFSTNDSDVTVSADMQVASGQLPSLKVRDNIAAYVNYADQFRIFYHGYIVNQEEYLIENFDVGRNTVAYVDASQQFRIFHAGTTRTIDNFAPVSYAAGDDVVAFLANDNSFKVYYNDSVYNLGYIQPDYLVADNIVAFEDGTGKFVVFYKGRLFTIDNYFPGAGKIVAGYNSLAYVDRNNTLRLFTAGRTYDVTSANLSGWRLDYDVLQYQFGSNMYKIFYQGRTY